MLLKYVAKQVAAARPWLNTDTSVAPVPRFDRGDRSLKTIEFNILSANGISILHQGKHFVGKHLAENIHTSYDVTIYLISIVTTIILVIADPILCNANRDAREFIISTFKCYKEWKKNKQNKTKQWVRGELAYYFFGHVTTR